MIDWTKVRLAAFDLDGTLYDQKRMRPRMAFALGWDAVRRLDPKPLQVVSRYRKLREVLAEEETEGFEPILVAKVAEGLGMPPAQVSGIVEDWINIRPLKILGPCRFDGVKALFDQLRASGRLIGVLSDYPAKDKLQALGLEADFVVSALDVGVLKPHPRGLQHLMALAGVEPHETIMIGDRAERDGEAARRAGVKAYILSRKAIAGWDCFASYADLLDTRRAGGSLGPE